QSVMEALRVDLGQSRVVRLLDPADVRGALQRMGRDPLAELDEPLALELAKREGAKAIVAGEIAPLGTGYVLTARVVAADSGTTLVPVRETAASDAELIDALNRLSSRLRERIGESLRSIRASDPLPEVTTASLAALQLYARGNRAFDESKYPEARSLLERAVAVDTSFAMAWRKLGALYSNMGVDPSLRTTAARKAFEHRDRLPPIERHLSAASFFWNVERQPERAIGEYQAVLDIDPDEPTSLNNLGMILAGEGRSAEAEVPLRRGLDAEPRATFFINLQGALLARSKWAALDSMTAAAEAAFPDEPLPDYLRVETALGRRDAAAADSLARGLLAHRRPNTPWRPLMFARASAAAYRGQFSEIERILAELTAAADESGDRGRALDFSTASALLDVTHRGQRERGLAKLEAALRKRPLDSIPASDQPYFVLAEINAWAGRPEEVRNLRSRWDRSTPRGSRHPADAPYWDGLVAMSEGRWRDAAIAFTRVKEASHCNPCGRLFAGMAWDRAGEADSALALYERAYLAPATDPGPEDAMFIPMALLRLGQLHEQKGDRQKALSYYGRFLDFWRDADPEFQPRVADARARIAALSAEPRPVE